MPRLCPDHDLHKPPLTSGHCQSKAPFGRGGATPYLGPYLATSMQRTYARLLGKGLSGLPSLLYLMPYLRYLVPYLANTWLTLPLPGLPGPYPYLMVLIWPYLAPDLLSGQHKLVGNQPRACFVGGKFCTACS